MHQKNENFQGLHTNVSREIVPLSCAKPADCSDDIVAQKMEGKTEQSELYVIGENLYPKERKYKGTIV